MGYLKETISGVSWMGALRAFTRAIAFVKIAVLARLLTPSEFGLFGIATLVLAFLEIITETGVNIFLIQERADLKEYKDTAWIVSIARGFLMFVIVLALSPFISIFFKSPESLSVLFLISLVPLIRGFINPSVVKFQKELYFNREFFFRSSLFVVDGVVAIIVAAVTQSAKALVWGMLASALLEAIYSLSFIRPRPVFVFDVEKIKRILGRGKWVTAAGFFNYLFENVDDMVVGRFLNTTSLGIYQVAYKISSLPITEIADVFIKVTFPVYVKLSNQAERLRKAFLKTSAAIALLVIPLGLILFFFSKEIVLLLLGEKWLEAVPVVKALSFFGVIKGMTASVYPFFLALRRQDFVMTVTLAGILGLAISIFPMVKNYGLIGAAYSALIGSLVSFPVALYLLLTLFKRLE